MYKCIFSLSDRKQFRPAYGKLDILTSIFPDIPHIALSDTQKSLLQSKLDNLRSEMEVVIEYRTRGAKLRSRARWHNEGEKNTKYFLNLEKRHYRQGTISRLKKSENDFATTDKEILHECESFFKDLFSSKMKTDSIS